MVNSLFYKPSILNIPVDVKQLKQSYDNRTALHHLGFVDKVITQFMTNYTITVIFKERFQ